VADASLFPTSLGVNPMLTTMVLARRVARAIRAETTAG
jgi:choline dehydrogenase-like flavoprotein